MEGNTMKGSIMEGSIMEDSVMDNSKDISQDKTTASTKPAATKSADTKSADTKSAAEVETGAPTGQRYSANDDVVMTDLGDELVLMAPASGKMFSLNSSGRTLWQSLPASKAELADALCDAFEVSREDALEDSSVWLEALLEAGLVYVQPTN
jgi:hypothetical protein